MKSQGFTLFELIVTLAILLIILTIGIPSFNKQIIQSRTKAATLTLLDAIETTRSTAVFQNKRIVLLAKDKKWHLGWTQFIDKNSNGTLEDDEILNINPKLVGVFSKTKAPMDAYISFIGTGEGKQISAAEDGGFLAGTINICPEQKGEGYALILSKGGRTRVGKLQAVDCDSMR